MKRFIGLVSVAALVSSISVSARAGDDKAAQAILDKGIKALGGAQKLSKVVKAATWKSKGKIRFGDDDNDFTSQVTVQGLDHFRQEFEGEFMGNKVKGVVVVNVDKAWRGFGGNTSELDKDAVANQKRGVYLQVVSATLLPLREKGFKVQAAPDEKVGDKLAAALKVTGPDGKEFKLYFDKDSGLPVKQVAKVAGFMGGDFTQETTFANYKDFGGIKRATKIVSTRDGQKFMEMEITEFAIVDKVDPKVFAEPQ
jgi:hypothetical protein